MNCNSYHKFARFNYNASISKVPSVGKCKYKSNLFTHGAPRTSEELVQKCPCIPGSNWNLEMLVFEERGKSEYPEKNLSEQSREPTTKSHI